MDYMIYDIPIYNQIVYFDLLNDHELDYDHRPLIQPLNFLIHKIPIEENYYHKKHILFDKSKVDIFLKDLNSELNILSYTDNIKNLYHNFTTSLSTSINKFSI